MDTSTEKAKPSKWRPRVRRQDCNFAQDSRETTTQIGWPFFYLEIVSHYHTWEGKEERTDRTIGFSVGPFRGFAFGAMAMSGCYPDTDDEGWPE